MDELVIRNGKPVEKERTNGHVYIVEREEGLLKIGKSNKPTERIKHISRLGGFKIKNQFISERCGNSRELEGRLHNIFKNENVQGEWFDVPFEKVVQELKKLEPKPIKYKTKREVEKQSEDAKKWVNAWTSAAGVNLTDLKNKNIELNQMSKNTIEEGAIKIIDLLMKEIEERFYLVPKASEQNDS